VYGINHNNFLRLQSSFAYHVFTSAMGKLWPIMQKATAYKG